jgi:hypothetical protein
MSDIAFTLLTTISSFVKSIASFLSYILMTMYTYYKNILGFNQYSTEDTSILQTTPTTPTVTTTECETMIQKKLSTTPKPVIKQPYTRTGIVPSNCSYNLIQESDGRCYKNPKKQYECVGSTCKKKCPQNYIATPDKNCILSKNTIPSDNQTCPWNDKCGLSFAKGCSRCPDGYEVDGCNCHLIIDKFKRDTYQRDNGGEPSVCSSSYTIDQQTGVCYPDCMTGYIGKGNVCYPIQE